MRSTPSRSASGRSSPSVPPQPPRGCAAPSSKDAEAIPDLVAVLKDFSLHPIVFHEVAYVLGKLQNKTASNALSTVLKNVCEHPTVRHEAAEALGSMRTKRALCFWRSLQRIVSP